MILETAQCRLVKFGIAEHSSVAGDQRDTVRKRCAGGIGEGVRIDARSPLGSDKSGFAQELSRCGVAKPVAKPPVQTSNGQYDEHPAHEQ